MTDTWDVVVNDELDDELLDGASAVIQSWFPDADEPVVSADVFRWKLGSSNPGGRGFMTVAVHGGRVVSSVSVTPRRFRVRGRDVPGAEVGDTYTDHAFLRAGAASVPWPGDVDGTHYLTRSAFGRLATETLQRADEAGLRIYFGVANELSFKAWTGRLGFRGWEGDPLLAYTRPGARTARRLARAAGPVAATLERLHARAERRVTAPRHSAAITEVSVADAAEAAEDLWLRVRDRLAFEPVRDGAWFSFRYDRHPARPYRAWVVRRGTTIDGVFVTRERTDTLGKNVVFLADQLLDETRVHAHVPFHQIVGMLGGTDTDIFSTWSQRSWPALRRTVAGVFVTHRPGLIVRESPVAPVDLRGVGSLEVLMGTSDNV